MATIDEPVVVPYWLRERRKREAEKFVPEWLQRREEWLRRGAPGAVAPIGLLPQIISAWDRAFVKEEYLFPQILRDRPILKAVREILGL